MNLSVGANIRRKRLERNLTQEEVAMQLAVSSQSISKWERGEGYPDIEMLPPLAHYFGISVDELLGVSKPEKEARYAQINSEWSENNENGLHSENVHLMKNSLKLYPNDPLLLVQLSTSLEKLDGTAEEKDNYLRESIAVQEQIINYCDDCEVRAATLYNICFAYQKIGESEKAIAQAEKLPNLYKTRENALVYLLEGEERRKAALNALRPLAWVTAHHLTALSETEKSPSYLKKASDIIDILFEDNDKDAFICRICDKLKLMTSSDVNDSGNRIR
ncbi:MAG: helix-turn-helix transcriptional regulator [Clostridia bacterium]|nr:helix-turn-helix transcriptional regulator [Clostridia bacterium]